VPRREQAVRSPRHGGDGVSRPVSRVDQPEPVGAPEGDPAGAGPDRMESPAVQGNRVVGHSRRAADAGDGEFGVGHLREVDAPLALSLEDHRPGVVADDEPLLQDRHRPGIGVRGASGAVRVLVAVFTPADDCERLACPDDSAGCVGAVFPLDDASPGEVDDEQAVRRSERHPFAVGRRCRVHHVGADRDRGTDLRERPRVQVDELRLGTGPDDADHHRRHDGGKRGHSPTLTPTGNERIKAGLAFVA